MKRSELGNSGYLYWGFSPVMQMKDSPAKGWIAGPPGESIHSRRMSDAAQCRRRAMRPCPACSATWKEQGNDKSSEHFLWIIPRSMWQTSWQKSHFVSRREQKSSAVLTENQQRMCPRDYWCLLPTPAPVHSTTLFYQDCVCSQPARKNRSLC